MNISVFNHRLPAIAAAALLFGTMSFVACDEFDDSAIQASISDLNSRVDALEEAVEDLQNQIDAINNMLDGGKIIKSVTPSSDGKQYVITYLGEGVAADIIKVEEATEAPAVTILQENGVYYWGKVNDNGIAEHLLGADNKIPVKTEIPETQAPKFSVDAEGNLQVSIDGGKTFVDAGIKISDVTAPLFKDVTVGEGEVTFTLQDDSSFTVPMTVELTCDIVSGRVVFQLSERKNIPVDASGYENYEVSVPYGWTANFNGTYIEVIAPATSDKALSGELVLRVYAGDRVKMDKININVGAQNIHVTTGLNETGAATVTVATSYDMPFYIGAVKLSEYSAEAAAQAAQPEVYTSVDGVYRHHTTAVENEDGSFTYVPCTLLFTDLVADPVPGEEYVIWTFEHPDDYRLAPENIQTYLFVYGQSVSVTVSDVTFHSASISIVPSEGTGFFYGIYPYEMFYALGIEEGKAGAAKIINDNPDRYSYTSAVSGDLAKLSGYRLVPGGKYVVWYALDNLGEGANYVASDIMVEDVELTPLTYDGTLAVEFGDVTATSSEVSAPFTVPAGVFETYVDYISFEDWNGKYAQSDRAVIDDLLENVWPFSGESSNTASESGLAAETEGYLVAVIIGNDGKVGPLQKVYTKTTSLTAADEFYTGATLSLAFAGTATNSEWEAQLSIEDNTTFEAGETLYLIYYYQPVGQKDGYESAEAVKIAMDNNPLSYYWDYGSETGNRVSVKTVTASQSSYDVTLSGLDPATEYMFVATLVKSSEVIGSGDAGGITSRTIEGYVSAEFTTKSAGQTYAAGSPEWEAMKPTVNFTTALVADMVSVSLTVTPADGTDAWWGCDTDMSTATMTIDQVKERLNGYSYSGERTVRFGLFDGAGARYFITWTDAQGNSYEPMSVDIPYPTE